MGSVCGGMEGMERMLGCWGDKKKETGWRRGCCVCTVSLCPVSPSLIGGGYLLSHFRSTIGAVRFNFSVRNGKRWIPHTITTFVSLFFMAPALTWALVLSDSGSIVSLGDATCGSK